MYISTVILILFVGIIAVVYVKQLGIENNQWNTAGKSTYTILATFRLNYEDIPAQSALYFVNTPTYSNGVPVFDTGLQDGLWFIYRDTPEQIHTVLSVSQAQNEKSLLPASQKAYIFQLDEKGNVKEIK